ncbi:FlgD immunoglobulin-like domain containing protein [Candidatus Zixiibacteriota bacterium]
MKVSTIRKVAILILLMASLPFGHLHATTWYIKADGSGDASSIQSAIYLAVDWDTILVAAGRYTGENNKNIDYQEKTLVVRSESGPYVTFIDCQGDGRGFNFYNGETGASKLEGLTITNGFVSGGDGGAIHCLGSSSPAINNCILQGNGTEGDGGGLCCDLNSSPSLLDCKIINNYADYGGGVCGKGGSSPNLTSCVVAADSAERGGGLYLNGGVSAVTDCIIVDNKAQLGGGIGLSSASPIITRSTIVGNSASLFGGGLNCVNSFPVLGGTHASQNSIYHNSAGQVGINLRTNAPIQEADFNYWGRVNDAPEDSVAIRETLEISPGASMNWWPISVQPLTITQKVENEVDTCYFPEAKIAIELLSTGLTGDSTITVTAWPDSMPPNVFGGKPLGKWFEISVGSGLGSFTANLTLKYTQEEFDSSDISEEGAIYCSRFASDQWSPYPGEAEPEENWVSCTTPEFSTWAIGGPGGPLTEVMETGGSISEPRSFQLSQNYPNPFNANTKFSFQLPERSHASVKIFNISGQLVRDLMDDQLPAGTYQLSWDGSDSAGRAVSSGLYLCRLRSGGYQQIRKLILLR